MCIITICNKIFIILLLSILVFICGCKKIKEKDLYGKYITESTCTSFDGKAKLILDPNGTYYQEIIFNGCPKTLIQQGKWSYDSKNKKVVFFNIIYSISTPGTYENRIGAKYENVPIRGKASYDVSLYSPWFCAWGQVKIGSYEYLLYVKEENADKK